MLQENLREPINTDQQIHYLFRTDAVRLLFLPAQTPVLTRLKIFVIKSRKIAVWLTSYYNGITIDKFAPRDVFIRKLFPLLDKKKEKEGKICVDYERELRELKKLALGIEGYNNMLAWEEKEEGLFSEPE